MTTTKQPNVSPREYLTDAQDQVSRILHDIGHLRTTIGECSLLSHRGKLEAQIKLDNMRDQALSLVGMLHLLTVDHSQTVADFGWPDSEKEF